MANIFNLTKDIKQPTIFLCNKNQNKIGDLSYYIDRVNANYNFNDCDEISFDVYKSINNYENPYWNDIQNLKLVYVQEYEEYYEIEVTENETSTQVKTVVGKSLCEAELSQLDISLEVNTEDDISRDDYEPTIIYNPNNTSASLLHRILKDKAPHYKIKHVDASLAKLQRTFSIDTTIDDFFRQELATEIDAHVEYDTDERGISLYDMLSVCHDCGHRGDFFDVCPECGSKNVKNGYGEWTNVYISKDNLADNVELKAETATIKNTFKVIGGDDTITNRIPMVNPNGTGYITKFSPLQYNDMPEELVAKLKAYFELCDSKKDDYKKLMLDICNCLDEINEYQTSMMPLPETSDTDAKKEIENITNDLNSLMSNKVSPNSIGINTFNEYTTSALVDNAVISYCKIILSKGYKVEIKSSDYTFHNAYGTWTGIIHVESTTYPDDDSCDSKPLTLKVDGDDIAYVTQKINKSLATKDLKDETYDYTLYSVTELQSFVDAYETCESILIDHGDSSKPIDSPQYAIYDKYRKLREQVVTEQNRKKAIVQNLNEQYDSLLSRKNKINDELNMQSYLGGELYNIYSSYRRDDKYENSNYISDGLSDPEIIQNIEKLLEVANKDLSIACQNQYSITATVNNLFLMDEFEPFHNDCRLGNWIYFEINNEVYTLRLVKLGIDYSSIDKIIVEFSNVSKAHDISAKISDTLKNAQSIASSYPSTAKQVSQDSKVVSKVNDWVSDGLDATNMLISNSPMQTTLLDHTGIWCRGYDDIVGDYEPYALRIINSTLAVTDDNWKTTKAAIGKFVLKDAVTGEYKISMGVIGETIVGRLLLGENLGIYNSNQSLTFNEDGLKITNGENTFTVNPNNSELITLSNESKKLLYIDEQGVLQLNGDGANINIENNGTITSMSASIDGIKTEVSDKVSSSIFTQKTNEIDLAIKSKADTDKLISQINLSTEGVKIQGDKVNINGQVTFESFDAALQGNINNISSNASDAKSKTDGLSNGTTVINGDCIQTGTLDASKITVGTLDALGIKAGSVDAENITGNTISGKYLSGCSGDITNIFIWDKTQDYQHGSICGQYMDRNGRITQHELVRVNNGEVSSSMDIYSTTYFFTPPILRGENGLIFGSALFNSWAETSYINMLSDSSNVGVSAIRLGFKHANIEYPTFETYDNYNLDTNTHNISAKVFGNLNVDGFITDQSSARYKTNIENLPEETALNLLRYNIVSFDYKDGRKGRHGMIAEQAATVSDYGVVKDKDDNPDSIGYVAFIPDIIKLNQIMYKEIQDLKKTTSEMTMA